MTSITNLTSSAALNSSLISLIFKINIIKTAAIKVLKIANRTRNWILMRKWIRAAEKNYLQYIFLPVTLSIWSRRSNAEIACRTRGNFTACFFIHAACQNRVNSGEKFNELFFFSSLTFSCRDFLLYFRLHLYFSDNNVMDDCVIEMLRLCLLSVHPATVLSCMKF